MANGRRSKSNLAATSSILPFLKPTEASTKTGQNETLPKPKVALARSLEAVSQNDNLILKPKSGSQRTGLEGSSGSQKLVPDFFLKKYP